MAQHRVRLMHRIAVDWVADTFGLRTPGARTRHENARFRATARAAALHDRARAGAAHDRASARAARRPDRARAAARANARARPARLHAQRGEPRILRGSQARIGRLLGQDGGQDGGQS